MTSWRSAWRSLRKAAGLSHVRFHDGRHTAITRLAEKGLPDWVIRAQFGHVSPAMMATYSHVRRKALDEAALALEPESTPAPPRPSGPDESAGVMSHVTSQQRRSPRRLIDFPRKVGAPCRTRTCDLLVRSQTLYPTELKAHFKAGRTSECRRLPQRWSRRSMKSRSSANNAASRRRSSVADGES
jgi:Phage integrase family